MLLVVGLAGCSASELDVAAAEQMCSTVSQVGHNLGALHDVSDQRLPLAAGNAVGILKGAELDSIVADTDAGERVEKLRRDAVLWFQQVAAGGSATDGRDTLAEGASTLWRDLECEPSTGDGGWLQADPAA